MSRQHPNPFDDSSQSQRALSRWDNEGGAGLCDPRLAASPAEGRVPFPRIDGAELEALHVRVIALENLVISLLAAGSEQQLELARVMATYVSPRSGFTCHPLTIHAAGHMTDLVDRASRFRRGDPS